MKPILIADRLLGPGHPCFVIAEMSANHKKSMARCRHLIEAAKEAGADAVKIWQGISEWKARSIVHKY